MKFKGLIITGALMTSLPAQADTFEMRYQMKGLSKAVADAPALGLSKLSCGTYHCYALKGGEVWSVGRNTEGQLGLGHTTNQSTWQQVDFTIE